MAHYIRNLKNSTILIEFVERERNLIFKDVDNYQSRRYLRLRSI
jgi:hypothetical protein